MKKNINNVGRLEALIMYFGSMGSMALSVICKNPVFSIIFSVLALVNAVIYLILLYSKKNKERKRCEGLY